MAEQIQEVRFYGHKRGPHAFMSNFYPAGFVLDEYMWFTNEHFYQAYKFTPGGEKFMAIRNAATPYEAKKLGNDRLGEQIRADWERGKKLEVMRRGLRAKFAQNVDLIRELLATGNAVLVEDAPDDFYWGIGDGTGQNWLGKLLMELRDELQERVK